MPRVRFDDGTVINFEGNPSQDDISDAYEQAKSLKGTPGNIPKFEGFLKSALGQATRTAGTTLGQMIPGQDSLAMARQLPGLGGAQLGTTTEQARIMKERGIEGVTAPINNPFLRTIANIAIDPETYIGGGKAIAEEVPQTIGKNTARIFKSLINPSKQYGKVIQEAQRLYPKSKVNFLEIIREASENPTAQKALAKTEAQEVLKKYGGTTLTKEGVLSENLSNLSLEESQDLINGIKSGVRAAVKSGDLIKPTEIPLVKMFSKMSKAQDTAYPGFEGAKGAYRFSKSVRKNTSKLGKAALTGAGITGGGAAVFGALKSILGGK